MECGCNCLVLFYYLFICMFSNLFEEAMFSQSKWIAFIFCHRSLCCSRCDVCCFCIILRGSQHMQALPLYKFLKSMLVFRAQSHGVGLFLSCTFFLRGVPQGGN